MTVRYRKDLELFSVEYESIEDGTNATCYIVAPEIVKATEIAATHCEGIIHSITLIAYEDVCVWVR